MRERQNVRGAPTAVADHHGDRRLLAEIFQDDGEDVRAAFHHEAHDGHALAQPCNTHCARPRAPGARPSTRRRWSERPRSKTDRRTDGAAASARAHRDPMAVVFILVFKPRIVAVLEKTDLKPTTFPNPGSVGGSGAPCTAQLACRLLQGERHQKVLSAGKRPLLLLCPRVPT